ncbi:hypothetical protein L3V83_04675 [Thiotrichales bacterium 19X7-9]|nr:hypothetical protein [Thiotrichales bacterium 19X7-9]
MKRAFIVDYTTNDNGDFRIYEIQNLLDSNLFKTIENELDNGIITARFYQSLPSPLGSINPRRINCKTDQRYLLQSFQETAKYNPDFMIIDRTSKAPLSHDEKETIRAFLEKYNNKVVIKTDGVEGTGNTFTKDMDFDAIVEKINQHLAEGKPISIEEQVMLTKDNENEINSFNEKYNFLNCNKPGIFRRGIVLYDPETDEIEHFEVYKQIIDTSETTCNHKSDQDGQSISVGYLKTYNTIDAIRSYTETRKSKHPERYRQRSDFFKDIARVIESNGMPCDNLNQFCLTDNDHRAANEKFICNQSMSNRDDIKDEINQKSCTGIQKIMQYYKIKGFSYLSTAAESESFLNNLEILRNLNLDSSENVKLLLDKPSECDIILSSQNGGNEVNTAFMQLKIEEKEAPLLMMNSGRAKQHKKLTSCSLL